MSRLYVLPQKDKLLLLHADEKACRQLDSGADPKDICASAKTIANSLIITISDDGTIAI